MFKNEILYSPSLDVFLLFHKYLFFCFVFNRQKLQFSCQFSEAAHEPQMYHQAAPWRYATCIF